MSEEIIVQFVGFQAKALVREYTFTVREQASEPREFTLTIANEAFDSHRARYQDAPDICSLKLRRELATYANHPPKTHFRVTDTELDDYSSAHTRKPLRNLYTPKARQDF
ncbi:MAG: hypothetical protein HY237_14545 [Acidobacteria bacterium]|nr:hypothetical protein [Acidobacteriota bacterium]